MRRVAGWLTAALLVGSVAGCAFAYESNREQLLKTAKPEDYGPPPPADYRAAEEEIVKGWLKDPFSAQFKFGQPVKDAIPQAPSDSTPHLVWTADVEVNAKNSYGAYAGFETYTFAWYGGKVFATQSCSLLNDGYSVCTWDYR